MLDLDLLGEEVGRSGCNRFGAGRLLSATLGALGQDQRAERGDVAGQILRISEHIG